MTSTNDEREALREKVARAICVAERFDPDMKNARGIINWKSYLSAADAAIASLPAPTPAAGEAVTGLAKDLGQLRQIFESWLARPANEQPVNPATGVRPFSTGDLRHLIDTMAAAQEVVRAAPQAPATGGDAALRSAREVMLFYSEANDDGSQAKAGLDMIDAALANHSPDAGGVGELGQIVAWLRRGGVHGIADQIELGDHRRCLRGGEE